MMWYWGAGIHGWAWGLGIFTSVIFWGLIIWAIAALVGWARQGRPGPATPGPERQAGPWPGPGPWPGDAEEILSRRFAAGEIGAREYRERLEVLQRVESARGEQRCAVGTERCRDGIEVRAKGRRRRIRFAGDAWRPRRQVAG